MNNDKIKACFDAISPDKEQKERILSFVSDKINTKTYPKKHLYRYISIAAALVLSFAGMCYAGSKVLFRESGNAPKLVAVTDNVESQKNGDISASNAVDALSKIKSDDDIVHDTETNRIVSSEKKQGSAELALSNNGYENNSKAEDSIYLKENDAMSSSNIEDSMSSPDKTDDVEYSDNSLSDMTSSDNLYARPSSGGGGSSSKPAYNITVHDISELISSSKYSPYIPLLTPDGFRFDMAETIGETLVMTYLSDNDRINIKIMPKKQDKKTVSVEEIISLSSDAVRLEFSLDMGEYMAAVSAPSGMSLEIYSMFKSCGYFN